MNAIRKIATINQKELESKTPYEASWHYDYRDTSYIHIGGLHPDLKEKDIIIIFSQYGVPTHIKMPKDPNDETKNRGFCFLKYSNYRSCVLAIDNFNGIKVFDRVLKVDHTYFKVKNSEREDDNLIDYGLEKQIEGENKVEKKRKLLKENGEENEFEDPMVRMKNEFEDPMVRMKENDIKDDDFEDPMIKMKDNTKVSKEDDEFEDPMVKMKQNGVEDDDFEDPLVKMTKQR